MRYNKEHFIDEKNFGVPAGFVAVNTPKVIAAKGGSKNSHTD